MSSFVITWLAAMADGWPESASQYPSSTACRHYDV